MRRARGRAKYDHVGNNGGAGTNRLKRFGEDPGRSRWTGQTTIIVQRHQRHKRTHQTKRDGGGARHGDICHDGIGQLGCDGKLRMAEQLAIG